MQITNRYFVFGDSISKGIMCKNNRLERLDWDIPSKVSHDCNIQTLNFSVVGQTITRLATKGTLVDFIKSNKDSTDKKYVVLELGGNDCDFDWKAVEEAPTKAHQPKTPIAKYHKLLTKAIKELKANGFIPVLCTTPPVVAKRYFDFLSTKYDGEKIMTFFKGDVSNIYRYQERYNFEIVKVANQNSCHLLDLRSLFLLRRNHDIYMSEDGIHPNGKGYELMEKAISKLIMSRNLKKA